MNFAITSAFGAKSFTGVATGKSASQSFTTRLTSVDAGSVTVDASAVINGATVTKQLTASYPATVCS